MEHRNTLQTKVQYQWPEQVLFFGLLACYAGICGALFYVQCTGVLTARGMGDMVVYVSVVDGTWQQNWDFSYPIMFWLGKAFAALLGDAKYGLTAAVTVLCLLTALAMKYYLDRLTPPWRGHEQLGRMLNTLGVFGLLFCSMITVPEPFRGKWHMDAPRMPYYLPSGTINPWHNATFLAARPFTIFCFFLFARLLDRYEEKMDAKTGALFSAALLLATMAKPSFTLAFVSTAGIIMLWRLLRSKFAGWRAFLQLGICFIPTFCALLYQYAGMLTGEGGEGIGFGFGKVLKHFSSNLPVAFLLGMAFPVAVLAWHAKELASNGAYRLSWQIGVVAYLEAYFLHENGERMVHANFFWGYESAQVLIFLCSLLLLLRDTTQQRGKRWARVIQWALFVLHVVCGIVCFYNWIKPEGL